MNIILLQEELESAEIDQLLNEFSQYLILSFSKHELPKITDEQWDRIEILFGEYLTPSELQKASQLRWIHSSTPYTRNLCMNEIENRGNILVTTSREENITQIGEFVMAGILTFAKNILHWRHDSQVPELIWDCKWRDTMWTLKDRIMIQVGLGKVGSEIVRRSREFDLRVWGVMHHSSFHPDCEKTFNYRELNAIIPHADIVCFTMEDHVPSESWSPLSFIKHMKEDSILIFLDPFASIDDAQLADIITKQHLRGAMIDTTHYSPIPTKSKLWKVPNIIITPEVSTYPRTDSRSAFRSFRYSLSQFVHGNYSDMKNLITVMR